MRRKGLIFLVILVLLPSWFFLSCACGEAKKSVGQAIVTSETQPTLIGIPDDASITVPAGTVPAGAIVVAQRLNPLVAPELPDYGERITVLYDFSANKPLQGPAIIRIPIPDTENPSLLVHHHNGEWKAMPFRVENGMAIVEVEDLSFFGWLDLKVSWLADKMTDFFTLRWLEEKPTCKAGVDASTKVDQSQSLGLILGCAYPQADGRTKLIIYNIAPLHLDVFPVEGIPVKLKRTGIFFSAEHSEGTIVAPNSKGEWEAKLSPGEKVVLEAYFSDAAVAALVGDLIPSGRFVRGLWESSLFARNGRKMTWGDIKGLLIIPSFAEASKKIEEISKMPILDHTRLSFIRKVKPTPTATPTATPKPIVKECQNPSSSKGSSIEILEVSPKPGTVVPAGEYTFRIEIEYTLSEEVASMADGPPLISVQWTSTEERHVSIAHINRRVSLGTHRISWNESLSIKDEERGEKFQKLPGAKEVYLQEFWRARDERTVDYVTVGFCCKYPYRDEPSFCLLGPVAEICE